ncbi:thiamine phosphate synthase [Cognaticolwellia beringensis]|uniref:Thiamine phosphate synthase n=1 Tax=Cognaticolwellia beringensis TaxID=1967665 RepID=A0A222G3Q7_9GAMM|nr:thiamine phosphate synthase [Cognaticolwellia beringensis]ASP46439.1 thiamine phosphate synthase [Cognaticolwellia beringensis]
MRIETALLGNKLQKKPIIWTISGADCSGGAGIAADIKTGHNLNVEVCHLITANTVQNSSELIAVNPTQVEILALQVQALRFDKPPAVIKIGLIANREQINWLIDMLSEIKSQLPNLLVVYDPVGRASVGGCLSSLPNSVLAPLMPLVDVITPNFIEAKQLCTLTTTSSVNDTRFMAEKILRLGCKAVIIKGGHNATEKPNDNNTHCTDVCLQSLSPTSSQLFTLQSPKINTSYSHGSGCSFASALASFLAHNYLLRDAFTLTKAFINQGLLLATEVKNDISDDMRDDKNEVDRNRYYGAFEQGFWPSKPNNFPIIINPLNQKLQSTKCFEPLDLSEGEKLGLYPVIDSLAWLALLLPLNLNIIQLRIKGNNIIEVEPMIEQAVAMARDYNCRLFINDHWQLAIKYGAYGVHIGQEDLNGADLNAIAKAGLRLGISTHGCYEFLLAKQLQPSYLAVGAIFPTKTKNMTGQIQGLENLTQILALADTTPVVAIGGINQQRLDKVWNTGVSAVAVVTAITEAQQPVTATKTMQARLC